MARLNKEIVLAFLDASERNDREAMKELLHPQVRIIEADSLPYGGVFEGAEGFIDLIRRVFSTWRDTRLSVQQVLADGDHVVILAQMSGRGQAADKAFSMPIAEVWLLEDRKIKEVRPFYFDTKLLHDAHFGP